LLSHRIAHRVHTVNGMTESTRVVSARSFLDDLMARVGVDGLVAAMRIPGVHAAVDQHAAAIRFSLREAGRGVDVVSLAAYGKSVLAVMQRGGRRLPDSDTLDWSRAPGLVLRLVAVCALAEATGCL
jgi:hypothetical protein